MKSKTKNSQSTEHIYEMIEKAFGREHLPESPEDIQELEEGFFNAAYNITLRNRKEVILKIAPPKDVLVMSYERNMMRTEVEVMRLVAKETNVPVPAVLFYDDSKQICKSEYFFMEKLDGASYSSVKESLSTKEREEIERELGGYNKEINELSGQYFGYPGLKELQDDQWKGVFGKMMALILADGERKQVDIGMSYEALRGWIRKYDYALEEINTPKLVHWDLWDGNVFVKNAKIIGLIDFERALWGDPLMEHNFQNIPDEKGETPFMEGYGQGEFEKKAILRRILYNIYLYFIMVIEGSYRDYEDDRQYYYAKERLGDTVKLLENWKE